MPSNEEMQAELERLRAENEALKENRRGGSTSMKVSEKGAVSVYGNQTEDPGPIYGLLRGRAMR